MREFLIRYSTDKNISILFVLFLIFNLWILPRMMPAEPLDLEIYYNAEEAFDKVHGFSKEIRESYKMVLIFWDMLYPLVYSTLFSFVIFRLWQNEKLSLLPFFILFFDITENICIFKILVQYPEKTIFWGSMAGISTAIKWLFSLFTILIVMTGFIQKVFLKKRQ